MPLIYRPGFYYFFIYVFGSFVLLLQNKQMAQISLHPVGNTFYSLAKCCCNKMFLFVKMFSALVVSRKCVFPF